MTAADEPAAELVEEVDEQGRVVGVVTRREIRARNARHRCTYVVVHAGGRAVLAHRRAAWKDVWPDRWDLAFGGVCAVGEAWRDAARRELAEEAGVTVDDAALVELGVVRHEGEVRVVGRLYSVEHRGPFTFADGEVVEIAWVPLAELADWAGAHELCDDSRAEVLPRLLHGAC